MLIALAAAAAVAACNKNAPQQNADGNLAAANDAAAAPEVEALPGDESSATPSNQLVNGLDNADVDQTAGNNSD